VAPHVNQKVLVRRFSLWARLTHGVLAISVFGLVFTGMPLKFSQASWAWPLMRMWGGPHEAGVFHRLFAIMLFGAGFMHLTGTLVAARRGTLGPLFGPDSIVPGPQDLRHLVQYLRYLLGRDERPNFGKYTYWEKFDYFAVFWGLVIIGASGLVMWFPEVVARYLPGWVVNAALVIHSDEALLAAGFLFAIHFFNTHLRPGVFPLDPVIFSGNVSLEELRTERPAWHRRLMASGGLDRESVPGKTAAPAAAVVIGLIFLALGIVMLVLMMSAAILEALGYLRSLIT